MHKGAKDTPCASELTVVVKFGTKTLRAPHGLAAEVKRALTRQSGLEPSEMKLVVRGKVVKDTDDVPTDAKAMLMRCAAPAPRLKLRFREIVSGRVATPLEVDKCALTHDELVQLATKTLRLPPCDEHTEVRLFLPHAGVLMRTDLHLSDYTLPSAGDVLHLFAVPCPIGLQKSAAMAAQAEAEAASEAADAACEAADALSRADRIPFPPHLPADDGIDALADEAAAAILASADSLSLHAVLEEMGMPPPVSLPPSLADVVGASAPPPPPALTQSSSSSSSFSSSTGAPAAAKATGGGGAAAARKDAASRNAASLVPARLRTGLMPAVDDMSPVAVEIPAEILAAELEAYEASFSPPTASEWEMMAAAEESMLEERCAELVRSLVPLATSPPPPRHRGQPGSEWRARGMARGFLGGGGSGAARVNRGGGRPCTPRQRRHPAKAKRTPSFADPSSLASSSSSFASASEGESEEDEREEAAVDAPSMGQCVPASPGTPLGPKCGKVKGSACFECGRRLPLTACTSACACKECFCAEHMHSHDCSVDYRRAAQRKLAEDNPKLKKSSRLERL